MGSLGNTITRDERPAVYGMNPGDGPHSYVRNSSYQRGVLDAAKPIIEEEIANNLDIKHSSSSPLCIADFGCSTGHNSFPAMQIIIDAIKKKQQETSMSPLPEFCVVFNDVVSNDYNTLFTSLPPRRGYLAVAVAGDFHRRLLPPSSLHFAYSSWSVHWLTKAPEAVAARGSPAWNGGRILYGEDRKEVCDAYLEQFGRDVEMFMESRAVEIVGGGLMALIFPGVPTSWNPQTEYTIPSDINLLGSCLVDMAKKGKLSKEKIDSFNLPYYFTTPPQLKAILLRSKSFTIQRMDIVNNPNKCSVGSVESRAAFYRAVHEELLARHFGVEIIDELFDRYMNKLSASSVFLNSKNDKSIVIIVVLKRIKDQSI